MRKGRSGAVGGESDERAIDRAIGTAIREARKARNTSGAQLAKDVAITVDRLEAFESGAARISAYHLMLITKALDIDIVTLLSDISGLA